MILALSLIVVAQLSSFKGISDAISARQTSKTILSSNRRSNQSSENYLSSSNSYEAAIPVLRLESEGQVDFLRSIGPLSSSFEAKKTGNWTIASTLVSSECVINASIDLLWTYEASGKAGLTSGLSPIELVDPLENLYDPAEEGGIAIDNFIDGFSSYLNDRGYILRETSLRILEPAIVFYQPVLEGGKGHAALYLGEVESRGIRYDIVAEKSNVHYGANGNVSFGFIGLNLLAIESSYRDKAFAIAPIPASC